jgi:hypothetical protein
VKRRKLFEQSESTLLSDTKSTMDKFANIQPCVVIEEIPARISIPATPSIAVEKKVDVAVETLLAELQQGVGDIVRAEELAHQLAQSDLLKRDEKTLTNGLRIIANTGSDASVPGVLRSQCWRLLADALPSHTFVIYYYLLYIIQQTKKSNQKSISQICFTKKKCQHCITVLSVSDWFPTHC